MKPFLEKYIPIAGCLPVPSRLSSVYVGKVAEQHEIALKNFVSNKYAIVFMDETPDCRGESMIDICAKIVSFDGKMGKTVVLDTFSLNVVNNETITQNLLDRLTEKGIRLSHFVALGMDNASYMKKAFNDRLSVVCPKLIGLFCLAHSLNLVAESFSGHAHFSHTDQFFHDVNRYFSNSTQRCKDFIAFLQVEYHDEEKSVALPPQLCSTRWRPWLMMVQYMKVHIDAVFQYFEQTALDNDANYLVRIKLLFLPENLQFKLLLQAQILELSSIATDFLNLLDFTEKVDVPVVHLAFDRLNAFFTSLKVSAQRFIPCSGLEALLETPLFQQGKLH